jgi:small subunit ribosomal protein S3
MGQKVHPYGFRLGVNKPWRSRWFVERDYDKLLIEDVHLRAELKDKLKAAGVSSVEIERPGNKLRLIIRTARPGIVIGRKGAEIEKLKIDLQKRTNRDVFIDILEVNKPELDAQLVAENIALQLEKRVGFRRSLGVVSAGAFAAAHPARRYRLRLCRSTHHVRRDRGQDLDLSR